MNAAQKAQAWIAHYAYNDVYCGIDAHEIITALLAEREALLGALTFGYADGGLQTFEHRQAFRKKAEEAIQLCEGE